jgi:hypothetical protein
VKSKKVKGPKQGKSEKCKGKREKAKMAVNPASLSYQAEIAEKWRVNLMLI